MRGAPAAGDVPVGLKELGPALGYRDARIGYTWSHKGLLPEPAGEVGGRPAWWLSELEEWDQQR